MRKGDSITITADNAKCSRCGGRFEPREGRYAIGGLPGQFHSRCLEHFDPATYHAGLIAGLRECAELADDHASARFGLATTAYNNEPEQSAQIGALNALGSLSASIRARIAALETEEKP